MILSLKLVSKTCHLTLPLLMVTRGKLLNLCLCMWSKTGIPTRQWRHISVKGLVLCTCSGGYCYFHGHIYTLLTCVPTSWLPHLFVLPSNTCCNSSQLKSKLPSLDPALLSCYGLISLLLFAVKWFNKRCLYSPSPLLPFVLRSPSHSTKTVSLRSLVTSLLQIQWFTLSPCLLSLLVHSLLLATFAFWDTTLLVFLIPHLLALPLPDL